MTDQPTAATFAWCFGHGLLHIFDTADPWCTSTWTPLNGGTREAAFADKLARYGHAKFMHQLPLETQAGLQDMWARQNGATT